MAFEGKVDSRGKRMSNVKLKTVYVPEFASPPPGSSHTDGPQPNEFLIRLPSTCNLTRGENVKRGNKRGKREKGRLKKKFNLTKSGSRTLSVEEDNNTLRRAKPQLAAKINKTAVNQGEETQCASVDSDYVSGDLYTFSQRPSLDKAANEKEKSQLAVLRTISKMLEENRGIRQRLASLSQANCGFAD